MTLRPPAGGLKSSSLACVLRPNEYDAGFGVSLVVERLSVALNNAWKLRAATAVIAGATLNILRHLARILTWRTSKGPDQALRQAVGQPTRLDRDTRPVREIKVAEQR